MLENITIENFRGIEKLEIKDFKRINMLVGKNNGGKTSILEAVFLSLKPYSSGLNSLYMQRGLPLVGYQNPFSENQGSIQIQAAPAWKHLFSFLKDNGSLDKSKSTKITSKSKFENLDFERETIFKPSFADNEKLRFGQDSFDAIKKSPNISWQDSDFLYISTNDKTKDKNIYFTTGIAKIQSSPASNIGKALSQDAEIKIKKDVEIKYPKFNIFFLGSNVANYQFLKERFDKIKNEDFFKKDILDFLKYIDPSIKNIGFDSSGEIEFELENSTQINMAVVGDGVKRVFSILAMIYECRNGVFFIDEIENGLHYSAQKEFWKILLKSCEEFNVQIFASTHSLELFSNLINNINPYDKKEEVKLIRVIKNGVIESDEEEAAIKIERAIEIR